LIPACDTYPSEYLLLAVPPLIFVSFLFCIVVSINRSLIFVLDYLPFSLYFFPLLDTSFLYDMMSYESQGIESNATVFGVCDYIYVDDAADGTDSFSASLFDSPQESFQSSCDSPVLTCVVKNEEDAFVPQNTMQSFEVDQQQGVPQTTPNTPTEAVCSLPHSDIDTASVPVKIEQFSPAVQSQEVDGSVSSFQVMSQSVQAKQQQQQQQSQQPQQQQQMKGQSNVDDAASSQSQSFPFVFPIQGVAQSPFVGGNGSNVHGNDSRAKMTPSERHKYRRRQKLFEQVCGSSPLPEGMLPPAILGGEMPPRAVRNPERKKRPYTEEELARRHKKGLVDDSDSESEERRLVRLPRPSLLTITTPQMTHYVKFLRATAELTPAMLDELCKQKRQVKNRESSSRFRAKKDVTLTELKARIEKLEHENAKLLRENRRLRSAVGNTGAGSSVDESLMDATEDDESFADSEGDVDEISEDEH